MITRSRPASALRRRHLLFISMILIPAVSSICILLFDRISSATLRSSQSRRSRRPVFKVCRSTLDSIERSLWVSCSLAISRLKIITDAFPLTAALRARDRANAVFPMAGLAARMIRSDFCIPDVISSSLENPVVIPVRPPSICSALSMMARFSTSTSRI